MNTADENYSVITRYEARIEELATDLRTVLEDFGMFVEKLTDDYFSPDGSCVDSSDISELASSVEEIERMFEKE